MVGKNHSTVFYYILFYSILFKSHRTPREQPIGWRGLNTGINRHTFATKIFSRKLIRLRCLNVFYKPCFLCSKKTPNHTIHRYPCNFRHTFNHTPTKRPTSKGPASKAPGTKDPASEVRNTKGRGTRVLKVRRRKVRKKRSRCKRS